MSPILRACLLSLVLLCVACSIASWVLVAINIRKQTKFWNTYSRIDPSFLVASIFAVFWYPFAAVCPPVATMIITALFALWFMGEGIAYTLMKWQWPTRCPSGWNLPSGCVPLYKAIWSFAWINFGLACLLFFLVAFIATRYSKRTGESGSNLTCWGLCTFKKPERDRNQVNNVSDEKDLPAGYELPPEDNAVQRLKALG